jgi:hypothetical protein
MSRAQFSNQAPAKPEPTEADGALGWPGKRLISAGIDRWITYGTQTSNTFSVQAVDSAGNRSPTGSVSLTNQTC